jgi:L-rhamnonate dehydratase
VASGDRVVRLEWAVLEGRRPRSLGRNARLPAHGAAVRVPLCRLTTADGLSGLGPSRLDEELGYEVLGLPVCRMFGAGGTNDAWLSLDYPLWDLAARRAGVPVWQLVRANDGAPPGVDDPPVVNCYDTSFYFEEELSPRAEAGELAHRAAASLEQGHRAFKVKVGRGARWVDAAEGMSRDVAVVEAVRDAIGPGCALLADANNGYTLNGAREFLGRTAGAHVGWLEEPFSEDVVLLQALRDWISSEGLNVLLADCESASPEEAYELAGTGVLDVVQCDILQAGFTRWLKLGPALSSVSVASAPHHFGLYLGNYLSGHLAGAVNNLEYVEWDQAIVPGLAVAGYQFEEGRLRLSDRPGFGIDLDDELFARAVKLTGFELRIGRP